MTASDGEAPESTEARIRRRIGWAAAATSAGIGLSVAADPSLGGWVTVGGVLLLVATLHRFGRLGPDGSSR